MSKVLVLANGKSFEFDDNSSITNLEKDCISFAEVDTIYPEITAENLTGATFDGEVIVNVVPTIVHVTETEGSGVIHAVFYNRIKSTEELMQEQITELQEAVAEIADL